MGIEPISAKSEFEPDTLSNLNILGLSQGSILTPTDYVKDKRLQLIGWLDQGSISEGVSRELFLRRLFQRMSTQQLSTDGFPLIYKLNRWAIEKMISGSPLGNFLLSTKGFTPDTFPIGPLNLLSSIEFMDEMVGQGVSLLNSKLRNLPKNGDLISIHELESDPSIAEIVEKSMVESEVAKWFRKIQ